jgi:hypothetical protein
MIIVDEIMTSIDIGCSFELVEKGDCSITPRRIGEFVVKWDVPHSLLSSG